MVSGLKHQGLKMRIIIVIMFLKMKQNPVQASMWNTKLNHQSQQNKIISTYEQEGVKLLIATV
jgi:hypothetical protein